MTTDRIVVPAELAGFHAKYYGADGKAWSATLPELTASFFDRWGLRLDGPLRHGMVGLIVPVRTADDVPAVLKLAPIDLEHPGEGPALRVWNGDGAVRLLDEDPATWTLLLERLDADRSLLDEPDVLKAVQVIGELLARLHAHRPPPQARLLSEVARLMIADVPAVSRAWGDAEEARLLRYWAAALSEVVTEPGTALLHWDLHYENVLAGEREPWLAIDPKPLCGDPGFDLLPALTNRWDEAVAAGAPGRAIRRRFDLLVEILGLDRQRAVAWTYGRVLQNALWDIEDGEPELDRAQILIAEAIAGERYR